MVACVLTLFLTGIGVFFTSVSQAPGIEEVADSLLPLNFGYNRVFGLSHTTSTWLAIPATFATGFGFMFVYGRQMNSMARSGLFPEIFKNRTSVSKTPYSALIFGSVLAIIGVIIVDSYHQTVLLDVIYHICTIASFTIYVFVFWSYIVFFERYSNVPRAFKNPFGRISAVIGLLIFLFALVAVLGFQKDRVTPITVYMVFVSLLVVYYYFFGFHTQKLSEEEHKALFKAYVINGEFISASFSVSGHLLLTNSSQ
jgi:amino acid transporter